MHAILNDYKLFGEWFDETGIPLMCEVIRRGDDLLWGEPWTDEEYTKPGPTGAEWRASLRAILLKPAVLAAIEKAASDPKHPAFADTIQLMRRYTEGME